MLEGWTALGFMAAHTTRARLGLMVGGVHYRLPGLAGEGRDDPRRTLRRPGLAGHRRRLERGGVARPWASRFRRWASASRCWRRRSGSPLREGGRASGAPRPRSRAATTGPGRLLSSPQAIARPPPADHDRGRRREEDAAPRGPSTRTRATSSGGPETIHHKYEVIREHCAAIGRDPDEIERSTLQSVKLALDGVPGESPQQVIDRFGELSDAGAQHVIFGVRGVWDPRVIEILARGRRAGVRKLG